jgi:hypothetical protein
MAIGKRIVKADVSKLDEGIHVSSENVTMEDGRLILRGRNLKELPHQTPVDIIVYFEDGIQFMWGAVTLSVAKQLNVEILSTTSKKEERRRNLKVRTSFDARVTAMYSLGSKRRKMNTDVVIRVRDLSLGGVGFFCDHPFFRRQRIRIDMGFLKRGFVVDFQILRKDKIQRDMAGDDLFLPIIDYRFRYGGRISRLSAEQERLICEYVFKVQIAEHQKRKEAPEELRRP